MADPVLAPAEVFCSATLNFAARSGDFVAEPKELDILDGRTAELPGWEECGFELIAHESAVTGWDGRQAAPPVEFPQFQASRPLA